MKVRRKKVLNLEDFYKEYVLHISNTLPEHRRITYMELNLLTSFWMLEGALAEIGRFSTISKRYIRESYKFKNYSNLENYISRLQKKGYIIKNGKDKDIAPMFNLPKNEIISKGSFSLIYEYIIE